MTELIEYFLINSFSGKQSDPSVAMISKTTLGMAAGLVGVIGYCIYFDRKRRSDPNFKQKLKDSKQ